MNSIHVISKRSKRRHFELRPDPKVLATRECSVDITCLVTFEITHDPPNKAKYIVHKKIKKKAVASFPMHYKDDFQIWMQLLSAETCLLYRSLTTLKSSWLRNHQGHAHYVLQKGLHSSLVRTNSSLFSSPSHNGYPKRSRKPPWSPILEVPKTIEKQ